MDKMTGKVVWNSKGGPAGYATPVPYTADGRGALAIFAGDSLVAVNVSDGKELWRTKWKTKHDVNSADPIMFGKKIFISSGYGTGSAMFEITGSGVERRWRTKKMRNKFNGCVLWKGHLYGFDEGSKLMCMDIAKGKRI